LNAAVQRIAAQVDRPPRDAQLTFEPAVAIQPSATGRKLDQAQARAAARVYVLSSGAATNPPPLTLSVAATPPVVGEAQLEPLRARADQLLNQPVVFSDGHQTWQIPSAALRSALVASGTPPTLDLKTDPFGGLV